MPTLALTGWFNAARLLEETGGLKINTTLAQKVVLGEWTHLGRLGLIAVLVAVVLAVLLRRVSDRVAAGFTVTYANGRRVRGRPEATLLEISRAYGVPHISICGGRMRCFTCRTQVLSGLATLAPPGAAESTVLARVGAGSDVRLACQIRPGADLVVKPLLEAGHTTIRQTPGDDAYRWGVERPVTVMFVDLRGFTALSEGRLPYDVVFIL
ncbi:2Fe-2S iron-sulfur cluster-binding protein [Breoghania sp.]|uniref:2Fe-2S iron-sulfur cluster-binding protein n=1 Tax=Breoghania sp. TaxID=2065378 RepID=UPI00261346C1|nr:2Fe-2S iron-sulfur cluster-binding protein [Breoghania sp.]MDJ0933620.1 2Fe-2S iron-sulfur cluster-binding protein [Breoghania sp.]